MTLPLSPADLKIYPVVEWTAWEPSWLQAGCNQCFSAFRSSTYQISAGKLQKNFSRYKSLSSLSRVGCAAPQTEHVNKCCNSRLTLSLTGREGSSCEKPMASHPLCWAGQVAMPEASTAVRTCLAQHRVVNTSSTAVAQFGSPDRQEDSGLVQLSDALC